MKLFDKKYIAVIVIKDQNSYSESKRIRFNPDKPMIDGKPIDINNPTFTKRLKSFFYIDNKGLQLSFLNSKITNLDSKVIDDILEKGLIRELTKGMSGSDFRKKLFDLITGALIGGLISFIISAFVFGGFG